MSRTRIALLALAFATALAGCGAAVDEATEAAADRVVEKAVESGIEGDVDIEKDGDGFAIETEDGSMTVDDDGDMVIESDEGTMTFETGEDLPADFPDVPLPDGMSIDTASEVNTTDDVAVYTISARIDGDAEEIFEAHVGDLEEAGFAIDLRNMSNSDGEFYGTVMASDGNGLQVVAILITEGGQTRLQLSATVTAT